MGNCAGCVCNDRDQMILTKVGICLLNSLKDKLGRQEVSLAGSNTLEVSFHHFLIARWMNYFYKMST